MTSGWPSPLPREGLFPLGSNESGITPWTRRRPSTRDTVEIERRTLKATTALNDYLDWPGVGQVGQVESEVVKDGKTSHEIRYFITSVSRPVAGTGQLLQDGPGGIGRSRIVLTTYVTSQWARTRAGSASVPVLK